jgi:electron transfer flavoprotein beta subunit
MQIYVCLKQVPDTAENISIVGKAAYDKSVKSVINPYDEYGVEEALQIIKAKGEGEVVVVTVGSASAVDSIRSALAVGAHRGILVKSDKQFIDSRTISLTLKKVIEQDGQADLIFSGKQSVDSEGMQTHYRLAAAMGLPVVSDVVDMKIDGDKALVKREIEGGTKEVFEIAMPCIIGATKGLNEPRYPKLPDILKARKKEIKEIDMESLGIEVTAPQTELLELQPTPERGQAKMLDGSPQEMAEELVKLLRTEAKVL